MKRERVWSGQEQKSGATWGYNPYELEVRLCFEENRIKSRSTIYRKVREIRNSFESRIKALENVSGSMRGLLPGIRSVEDLRKENKRVVGEEFSRIEDERLVEGRSRTPENVTGVGKWLTEAG